jgi:hypothetical protein
MRDQRSAHLKVQEMADCYAEADPLQEMAALADDADQDEAALKWLALAALHAINGNAKKITISRQPAGEVEVTVKYHKSQLPSPGPAIGDKIFQAARDVTHIEADKGKMPLSLGIRDGSIDVDVKIKREDGWQKLTLKFPESRPSA